MIYIIDHILQLLDEIKMLIFTYNYDRRIHRLTHNRSLDINN